jgi:hypothetical protein
VGQGCEGCGSQAELISNAPISVRFGLCASYLSPATQELGDGLNSPTERMTSSAPLPLSGITRDHRPHVFASSKKLVAKCAFYDKCAWSDHGFIGENRGGRGQRRLLKIGQYTVTPPCGYLRRAATSVLATSGVKGAVPRP